MNICEECGRETLYKRWCQAHWKQMKLYGRIGGRAIPATFIERLWRKSERTAEGCRVWTGTSDPGGYGTIKFGERTWRVHRIAYEMMIGPIPDGLVIDHLCRNRACWWPPHLEAVTPAENSRRGSFATRTTCSEGHPYDYVYPSGARACRQCLTRKQRERVQARRARY